VVDNGGDAAIGVQRRVPRLLLGVLPYVHLLCGVFKTIGLLELLEEDGDLVAVGSACGA
jgi:hypothetical protein